MGETKKLNFNKPNFISKSINIMLPPIKKLVYKIIRFPLLGLIQSLTWRFQLRECGKKLFVRRNVKITAPKCLSIGNNVLISKGVTFTIGVHDKINNGIFIKDRVIINKGCDFGCNNKIVIEEDCLLAPYVHISDRNHEYKDISQPIKNQGGYSNGPVIIGSGSWLGYRSQVLSGVTIGKNCVIAAGAIVTKDIPDYCVAAGNPAKIIRRYNFESKTWEKV